MNTPTDESANKKKSTVNMKKSPPKQDVPHKKTVNNSSEIRRESSSRHVEVLERSHLYQIKRLLLKQTDCLVTSSELIRDHVVTTRAWRKASFYLLVGLAGFESARVVLWVARYLSFH